MDYSGPQQLFVEGIGTLGPNFGSKDSLALNSKICNIFIKPHNMGVYGLTWTPAIFLKGFGPWGQILGQGPFEPKFKKFAIFSPK